MYYFDPYYLFLVVPSLLIAVFAQMRVSSTFAKYNTVNNSRRLTGADVARRILDSNGLYAVRIEQVAGKLTDHFDPRTNVVRLSQSVYGSTSIAAAGVAAHEVGHAIQHHEEYTPMKIRAALIPVTNLGSTLAFPIAILGIFMSWNVLTAIGIWLFAAVVLFQLVTLPVEFNASKRALATITEQNILDSNESKGAKSVLTAAAMTYVAALLTSLMNLIRLLLLAKRNDRD